MNHFVLGFVSYRDSTRGTPFIETLVDVIEQHTGNNKLVDIAKIVIMANN
jgi:hypothetical protein